MPLENLMTRLWRAQKVERWPADLAVLCARPAGCINSLNGKRSPLHKAFHYNDFIVLI